MIPHSRSETYQSPDDKKQKIQTEEIPKEASQSIDSITEESEQPSEESKDDSDKVDDLLKIEEDNPENK
jgi:hypothetical protein